MSIKDVKNILGEISDDPDSLYENGDALDQVIRKLIAIEKKHLFQVESTTAHRRLEEIRKLLDKELPKVMGTKDAS